MSFYKSLALTGVENPDSKALVRSLISQIRIADILCIDSVKLLDPKTTTNSPTSPCTLVEMETQRSNDHWVIFPLN